MLIEPLNGGTYVPATCEAQGDKQRNYEKGD
jgi:hypothetical protein